MNDLSIQLTNPQHRFPQGESVPVRFVVSLSPNASKPVELPAGGVQPASLLNTDLLTQDVQLHPGESIVMTVHARFDHPGSYDYENFALQVNPVTGAKKDRTVIKFPPSPIRVVPCLERALEVVPVRICGYDDAVKVELVLENRSSYPLVDVEVNLDRPEAVYAGPLRRQIPSMKVGESLRFDLMVKGQEIALDLAATIGAERVREKRLLRVPEEDQASETYRPFIFLEPRSLTTDRVVITPVEGASDPVGSNNGVFRLRGKTRYHLSLFPSNPATTQVKLYPVQGQVEVEERSRQGGKWDFLLTVVENPTLAQLIRLDYDVQAGDVPQRGELYVNIMPTFWKHASIAITAGVAVTVKGIATLVPAVIRSEPEWGGFWEHLWDHWLDTAQVLSIPLILGGLAGVNYFWANSVES